MRTYYICEEEDCNDAECEVHCEHDYDVDEGYTCLNCGKQGDLGELIDAAKYHMGDDHE
jgi:hypothetical protein